MGFSNGKIIFVTSYCLAVVLIRWESSHFIYIYIVFFFVVSGVLHAAYDIRYAGLLFGTWVLLMQYIFGTCVASITQTSEIWSTQCRLGICTVFFCMSFVWLYLNDWWHGYLNNFKYLVTVNTVYISTEIYVKWLQNYIIIICC